MLFVYPKEYVDLLVVYEDYVALYSLVGSIGKLRYVLVEDVV